MKPKMQIESLKTSSRVSVLCVTDFLSLSNKSETVALTPSVCTLLIFWPRKRISPIILAEAAAHYAGSATNKALDEI